jgi:hypothetical protein
MRSSRVLRPWLLAAALCVSLGGTTVLAQSRADSPGAVLGARHRAIAGCVTGKGQIRLLLRLYLDKQARVKSVEIESEAKLSKKARACITGNLEDLQFGTDLAGQILEHEMLVVNSGAKPRAR